MLYLIRHGQTDWNKQKLIQGHSNIPLNEEGKKQAKKVAKCFENKQISRIYASDLSRAYETAKEIAKAARIKSVETCEKLRERSFGDLEAKSVKVLYELVPNYATNWGAKPLYNIEALEVAQRRFIERLTEIMENSKGEKVVVVSHGAVINAFIHHVTSGEHGTGKTILHNTSITTFTYNQGKWKLEQLNDCTHII
ncbi:histidine phosphatase family protein [Priestia megaterium]|nr:histidine phosphatase family protein [Priestia megaterium]